MELISSYILINSACDYLSMLVLKLIHINKRDTW